MTLRIERLPGPDAIEALTAEWDLLDAQLCPRTPFTSPMWATLWWKYLRQTRMWRRHEFFVHVVRDDTNRLVAVVPLVISHQPALGPLRLRILQFFGASDGNITEHRRIVCRPEDEAAVIEAFSRYLSGLKMKWDLFLWTGIRNHDMARIQRLGAFREYRQVLEYVVSLPASWKVFRSRLSRNMREKIRKCYRVLARDGQAFVFRAVEQSPDLPAALDRFLVLHAARAQDQQAFKHRNYFTQPSQRAFIIDCASRMAQRGQFAIFELEIGGKVVASRLAFVYGREMYFYYSGFDPSWGKHSVMTTLMCESFKWAIERGVQLANLSKGKDLSKLRWDPDELVFHDTALVSPTPFGQVAFKVFDVFVRRFLLVILIASAIARDIDLDALLAWQP
jgi:CelD/BcsL family acetyltransferase involved in cellulose biosynthesis